MNRVIADWHRGRNHCIALGAVLFVVLAGIVLLFTVASAWCALALLPVSALSGWIVVSAVSDYRRNMAAWLALPDRARREIEKLCAEERQTAYCRLLRGYLTPYGMLLREGFFAWDSVVSVAFWEKGRKFSRAADWWNFLSGAVSLFGNSSGDYVDPESPAQCRITVREGDRERCYSIMLDSESFDDGGVERVIEEMKKASPVALTFR